MKKILAVTLVVTMVLCSFVVSAGAIGPDFIYEIRYGETITVNVPDSLLIKFAMVEFVPEKSGAYALTSSSDNDLYDPYCMLMDTDDMTIVASDDDYYGYDFCLKYYFEAGKTYSFAIYNYEGPAEFDITLGCAHNYIDGFCEYCSEECPHIPHIDNFGFCLCNKVFAGTDIYENDTITYVCDASDEMGSIFRFIPSEDGAYVFSSLSDPEFADPSIEIYDEEFIYIGSADDENEYDFSLAIDLQAGKPYYVFLYDYSEGGQEIEITVKKAEHEAEDGSIHSLTATPEIPPTCTESGYTQGLYCEECEKFISGNEEIEMTDHWDFDGDGRCEMCDGEVPLPDCSHICHSNNKVVSFIWKIVNFFNKLFRVNPICECGCYHF